MKFNFIFVNLHCTPMIKLFYVFRRLNAELEAKTADLVRQAEEVIVSKLYNY